MKNFIALLFVSLSLLGATSANADCVSDCQASTYCGGDSWDCAQLQQTCYQRECNNSSRVSGAYGAVAYDKDSGAYGLADGSPTEAAAQKSAMRFCRKNGENCKVVEEFSNTCAAIAQNKQGSVAAWATDDDKKDAAKKAVKKCNKDSDKEDCYVAFQHCYSE